jgi:hypothetical protein
LPQGRQEATIPHITTTWTELQLVLPSLLLLLLLLQAPAAARPTAADTASCPGPVGFSARACGLNPELHQLLLLL